MADGANALLYAIEGDYTNAGISAIAMVPIIGSYATSGKYAYKASDIMRHMGTNYTKSNIKLGNKVHSHYKNLETDGKNLLKEYSIRGGRVDFINKETHTIYELKQYNPNNVRRGIKQLERYKRILEESGNIKWKTVLDFY